MSVGGQEYLIAPWGNDDCETEIVTVELPSREYVVQLEVPAYMLERMVALADEHDVAPETVLAERLEINRAQVACNTAEAVVDVADVKRHPSDAQKCPHPTIP